jgi:hypothetical protein
LRIDLKLEESVMSKCLWLKLWEAPAIDPTDDVGSPTAKQRHKAVSVFERPLLAQSGRSKD